MSFASVPFPPAFLRPPGSGSSDSQEAQAREHLVRAVKSLSTLVAQSFSAPQAPGGQHSRQSGGRPSSVPGGDLQGQLKYSQEAPLLIKTKLFKRWGCGIGWSPMLNCGVM